MRGPLIERMMVSLQTLADRLCGRADLAGIFTTLAVSTRVGTDFLSTLTAMFNPLPAIALLPLALLWFGLGAKSLVFVIIHSVLWAVALNTHSGFTSVSPTLRMAGQNCGLRGVSYVAFLLVPAAFPSILTGLKIGWAFAWRTLIAAELVFGVSSRSGGLGWFIFENRNQLEIPTVFAGLFTVILIGLVVESVIFRSIENVTIRRWGMQSSTAQAVTSHAATRSRCAPTSSSARRSARCATAQASPARLRRGIGRQHEHERRQAPLAAVDRPPALRQLAEQRRLGRDALCDPPGPSDA